MAATYSPSVLTGAIINTLNTQRRASFTNSIGGTNTLDTINASFDTVTNILSFTTASLVTIGGTSPLVAASLYIGGVFPQNRIAVETVSIPFVGGDQMSGTWNFQL